MMKISIKTIPHKRQRYETSGDYWITKRGDMEIRVSEMKDWKEEALIAIHEIIELLLVKERGINIQEIEAFDIAFEKRRKEADRGEPGDHKDAPYRKEHKFATKIERLLARELGVDWEDYAGEAVKV